MDGSREALLAPGPRCCVPLDLNEEQAYGLVNAEMVEAVAYIRTSSAANVGADEDSDKRQRQAIESFAKANGCKQDLTRQAPHSG